jgi:hypothetical protein
VPAGSGALSAGEGGGNRVRPSDARDVCNGDLIIGCSAVGDDQAGVGAAAAGDHFGDPFTGGIAGMGGNDGQTAPWGAMRVEIASAVVTAWCRSGSRVKVKRAITES